MVVQMFWSGDVALSASPYYFRGYDVENVTGGTFSGQGATVITNRITMTDSKHGEAIGFVALDDLGHDISTSIDLGGLEIDFSTTTTVTQEGTGGAENDVPTVQIAFCQSNYSNVISTVSLAKPDKTVSGSVALTSGVSIPVGTRSVIIYLYGDSTSGTNTVVFENTSFKIHDASAPVCSVDYNQNWTNDPVTVTITASDSDSGLEGIYKNGVKVSSTSPLIFDATSNTGFTVYSLDYAGKTSSVQTVNITNIDTGVPAAPASLALSKDTWTNSDVTVTVPALSAATGSPERYIYQLNGGAWANLPAGFTVTDSGQFNINVAVADEAGNTSSALSDTIYIDKLPPTIDKVSMVVGSGTVDVTVQTSEAGLSGIGMLKYAEGSHDAAYFTSGGGTDIVDGKFSVSAGGLFTIYVTDNAGNSDIGEYTLNTAPSLAEISDVTMDEDTPYTVILNAYDGETPLSGLDVSAEASDNTLITHIGYDQSDEGINLILTPGSNLSGGPVTVTVEIADAQGEKVTKTFNVTVAAVNDPPVAVNDGGIVTTEDTAVKIDVLGNDYDTADGDTLTITDPGTPAHGTTSIVAGQIRYAPAANYSGTDQFTYTISDGHGGTATATVFISATEVNDAPVAVADTATVEEDSSVLIPVLTNDTDIDTTTTSDETISLYSVQDGLHGTAVAEGNQVRYRPEDNFFGKDTFTYVIHDSKGAPSTGIVTVTVTGTEDAPYFEELNAEYTISEDSIGAAVTFLIKDIETVPNTLMLQAVSDKDTLLENSGIAITGLGDSNPSVTLRLTPVPDANGDVTVTLSLGDGFTTVTDSFLLHITNVNDAPTTEDDEITYTEDDSSVLIEMGELIANDTDIEGDSLSFGGIYTETTVGTLTQVDADTYEYTPKTNYDGEDSFQYYVSDGHGGIALSTCVLKALPVNDAPKVTIPGGPYATDEDTESAGITINISDQETAARNLLVSAVSSDTGMIASDGITIVNNNDGTCTITISPIADATGTATITVTVSDGSLAASRDFTITINPMPDAPVAVGDNVYVPISGRQTFAVLNNDRDVDGDALTVVEDSWLPLSLNGALTFDPDNQKFTYRAANGEVGTGTFTYRVTDGTYTSDPATVTLSIHSITHAPEMSAIANQYITEDDTIDVPFTVTDVDLEDTAAISVTSSDTTLLPEGEPNIRVIDNGDGSFTLRLRPAGNQSGSTTITVTATDSTSKTDVDSFVLFVYPDNDPPTATDDTYTVNEDNPQTLTLTANDSDPEGDTIWVNAISWPAHGWLYRSGADYVYVPYGNWNGTETLSYSITDGQSYDTGSVTINVTPVNDDPVNYSNWVELPNEIEQSVTVNVLTSDYDPDGDEVRLYQIVSGPSFGDAEINTATGEITYTRSSVSPNFNGTDEIRYRIIDRETATGDYRYADAYVYIGVDFVSSLYCYDRYVYCYEDDGAFTFDLDIVNPNLVTYNLTVDDTTALGTLEVLDNNTVKFTPDADQNGTDMIPYTVTQEGGGETDTGYISLRVYPVNDAPVIDSAPVSVSCAEDGAGTNIMATFHDVDCAAADLYFYAYGHDAVSGSPVALAVELTINREDGTAQINARPVANANGTIDIVLGVSDGIAQAEKTVLLTVVAIDDAPVLTQVNESLYEDMDVTFDVLAPGTDVDGDAMNVTIEAGKGPQHGTARISGGKITYTPDPDYYGSDSLEFTATDETEDALTDTQTASFTVMPVNDQPVISNLNYYQSTKEDTPKDVPLTVTDVDNDLSGASSYTIKSDNQALIPDGNISISQVSGTNMSIHLVPADNASGSAIITIVASDGTGEDSLTAEASFKLTVEPVNDLPGAADDTASVDENVGTTAGTTSVTIDLMSNDSDVETGTLRVIAVSNISKGTVVNNGGVVTYSVEGDYSGTATFDYTLMDAGGATDTAHVTVTINPKNDPPRATNDSRTIVEDNSVTIPVLENDSDIEGDTLTITGTHDCAHGTATVEGNSIKYTPSENYNGTDTFSYDISDGNDGTATAQVTIKVTPVNDAPEIEKYEPTTGEWTMEEDTPESFNFIVSDAETAVTNLIITMNSKNTAVIKNTGIVLTTNAEGYKVITVTPQEDQNGVVPVDFKVTDGALAATVTWNITIAAVNDAPEIDAPAITTMEDKPVSGSVTAEDPEGDALKFYKQTDPAHGSVTVNEDGTYTYTPAADYSGTDSFDVYVDDEQAENNTATGTVHVTVTPLNDRPVAADDTAGTAEDTAVIIPVLDNDTDPDTISGDTLTVASVGSAANGSVAIVAGGVEYTPRANWNGTDTFTYTVKDEDGEPDTATVTVTVTPANDAPANGDIITETDEDTVLTIELPDDIDIDEQTNPAAEDVNIIAVDDPAHGTASVSTDKKSIIYTPDFNWYSTEGFPEVFNYTVKDAGNAEREFSITVIVNPVNDDPWFDTIPANMSLTEDLADGSSDFVVADAETPAASLSVTVLSSTNSALVATSDVTITAGTDGNRTVIVNPKDNKNGEAYIQLRVTDADGGYTNFLFKVTVAAVNDVPVAQNDSDETDENNQVVINVLANDDVDLNNPNDTLTILGHGSATYGIVDIVGNRIAYTPDATRTVTESYTDTFSYTMQDASLAQSSAWVTVTVTPVNDAPVITDPIEDVTIAEDTEGGTGVIPFDVSDEEDDDDTLVVTAASSNTALIPVANIDIVNPEGGETTNRTVQATPVKDGYGEADITLTVTDANGLKDIVTFTVTVTPVDDPLGTETKTYTVTEDVEKQLMVLSDADVDDPTNLTITQIVTPAGNGTVRIAADGKSLYYLTAQDSNADDTFVYRVHDAFSGVDYSITANIEVTPVNDAPVVTLLGESAYSVSEGGAENNIPFSVTDVDNNIDTEVTLASASSNPVLVLGGMHIDAGTGSSRTMDVQAYRKWNGTTTITITATDSGGLKGSASFTFTVTSVNEAPVAVDDALTAPEDALTFLDVLDNDTDGDLETNPDTERLVVQSVTDEDSNAEITKAADGSGVNIQPRANWNGTVTFTYIAADTAGATSNTATVTVTVTQVNDAPVADDDTAATNEDTAITISVLDGDTDIDQDASLNANPAAEVLSVSLTGALDAPDHGSVSTNGTTVTYTPAANFNGTDSFEYFVKDGEAQDKGLVTVTVSQVNDNPVAVTDTVSTPEDTAKTIDVLYNDTDVDTNASLNLGMRHNKAEFSISLDGVTTAPAHGSVSIVVGKIETSDMIKYTPDANYYGTDTFTYFVLDGHGGSAEGTVNVTVTSVNDLPKFDTNPADMSLTEDVDTGSSSFTVSDVETPNTNLVMTIVGISNPTLVETGDITITKGAGGARTVTVDPKYNQNGTADITLRVTDGDSGFEEYTFRVTVAAVNDAPVGLDNAGTINEDTSYTVDWTGITGDVDIVTNGDTLGVEITTQAAHGNAVVSGSNIIYTPAANWNGVDSFVYTVSDGEATDTGTITVTVDQVNDAPVADDDFDNTNEENAVTIDVLTGDTDTDQDPALNADPEAETLSVTLTGELDAPDHGSVSTNGTTVTYTPDDDYNGIDSFEYFVTDGEAQDKGLVTVTVGQVNDNPVAVTDTATTPEDTAKTIDVLGNDTDVDTDEALNLGTLHYEAEFSVSLTGVTTAPAHGSVAISGNQIIYTPASNYYGSDTFTYKVLDGHGGSDEGTVNVTVDSENDPPRFVTNPANMDLFEDGIDGSSTFTVSDVETPAASLTVTVEDSSNTALVDLGDVTILQGLEGARTVTVNPKSNRNGTADITLRVTDGSDDFAEYTFTVTVEPVNDAPVGIDNTGTINEDTSYTVDWTSLTSDVDIATNGDTLGVTITGQGSHGNAVVSGNDIIYTPDADWNGVDSFVYTVTDSHDATDTGTITVTVSQVNDAPEADDDSATTNEEAAVTISVLTGDSDKDQSASLNADPSAEVLSVSLTGALDGPDHGSVSTDGTTVTYTPDENYNGTDTFEYFVSDGDVQDKGLVTVTINQVNDNPVAMSDSAATDEDETKIIDVLANDTDVDTDETLNLGTLHYKTEFSVSLSGATVEPANGSITIVDNKIQYTPDADWNGTDTFTYWVQDGHGGSAEGTVTIVVGGENDAPVAADDSAATDEDEPVSFNVLTNDFDEESGVMSLDGFTDAAGIPGEIVWESDGDVTFTPDADYNGSFTIHYQMSDDGGLTDTAAVTITVNALNDDPIADSFADATNEDTAKGIDVGGRISDADIATNGDSLTVSVETGGEPSHGSVSVEGTVITYTPDADWNGTDSFTYTIADTDEATDTGVVTITVAAVNDAPVADDETANVQEDSSVTIDVLDGDTDVDMDSNLNETPQGPLTIGSLGTPSHGSVEIEDGKIVYTPDTNYSGTDSFTYTASDSALTDTGLVTVTIAQVNDAPDAVDDTATTNDEELVTIDVLANDQDTDTQSALNQAPDSRSDFRITAVTAPTNGTAAISGNRIQYKPVDTFAGEDSFTYTMSDGHGGTDTATVTVTVVSVNDPPEKPVVHTPADGERYGGESTLHVTWTGFDIDGDTLSYTLEYYDGTTWRVVQTGLSATAYDFVIPKTLTSILNLQFRVNASDAEFTSGYGYSGKVEVDKSIPTNVVVTMKTADGRTYTAGTWTNQNVIVTAVSVQDASRVVFSYAIEDKAYEVAANRTVTSGVHTVYVLAKDEFGNAGEFGGYLVRIDKQAPAVPEVSMTAPGTGMQISLTPKADPGGSGNNYLIMPDGARIAASADIKWIAKTNGDYTFKIYDIAGNVTTFTVTVDQIDESAPVITCDSGDYQVGNPTEQAITASLSFTDSESEITAKGYALSENASYSGAYKTYTDAIELTEPGTYYIHAYARNAFGITTNETFGPFIIAAKQENPETSEEPGEVPPETGTVIVDVGDIADISDGAKQVRLPGGEWSDTLSLEDIAPGTYIIEVMDEDGNVTTVEITISDEEIAAGQWKPTNPNSNWYVWTLAGFALLLILLLLLWRNVKVTMYDANSRELRSIHRLRRRKDKVQVTVAENAARGSLWGTVILGRAFTRRMRGNMLIILHRDTEVLRVQVPEDADGMFEARIESWNRD